MVLSYRYKSCRSKESIREEFKELRSLDGRGKRLRTSGSSDRKVKKSIRITSETILPVRFFTNVM